MSWSSRILGLGLSLLVACGGSGTVEEPEEGGSEARGVDGAEGNDASSATVDTDEAPDLPPDPRTLVEVEPLGRGTVSDVLTTSGSVESDAQADLVPEATGTVTRILVEEGDPVRRGDVLAVLENANLDASLERTRAELARAEADLAKLEALQSQGAVSDREVLEGRRRVESANTALQEASRTWGETRITSPIDGTVAVRDVRLGELAAGGRRAFQVVDLDRLRVVVQLPEKDLARVSVGQVAELVGAYDEATTAMGKVVRVAPTVDSQSGTVRVTVALDAGQTSLRPGQFVSVRLEVGRHEDVLAITRRALVYEDGEPYLWRVREEEAPPEKDEPEVEEKGRGSGFSFSFGAAEDEPEEAPEPPGPRRIARKVPVTLGYTNDREVEVLATADGPVEGDAIVVVGVEGLREGTRVRYPEDPGMEPRKPKDDPEGGGAGEEAPAAGNAADDAE